jgi:HNH endonuclease
MVGNPVCAISFLLLSVLWPHQELALMSDNRGANIESRRAWLLMAVGDNRQHGGNEGYEELPAETYSWDSTVANHKRLRPGDYIAIWDKKSLLGASVIESISRDPGSKRLHRCPSCGKAGIKARKTISPRYKCYHCKATFDQPTSRTEPVTAYQSNHGVAWVDLSGRLTGQQLRRLCDSPRSQLSIRPLRWPEFRHAALSDEPQAENLLNMRARLLTGGHTKATVRIRKGQGLFRSALLERFGEVCAFTGPAPPEALEACHLYSYANVGEHHSTGGLLLRRDIHRLFDRGLLTIDPGSMQIEVGPQLMRYPDYAALSGTRLRVSIGPAGRDWLAAHRAQYRVTR